jgi:N-ethylmaleimide reductase
VAPVAPSAIRIENDQTHTPKGKVDFETPHVLTVEEIASVVAQFGQAAANAKAAGFDGVEIHGANGYLIDQFLRDGTNQRTDEYGGPLENRLRFLREVLDAVIPVFGAAQTGLRISTLNSYNEMKDSDPIALTEAVARLADEKTLGYLHIMRGDFLGLQHGDLIGAARPLFRGALMGNAGFTPAEAEQAIASGQLDLVAFGHHFISNPDLVDRVRHGHPFAEPNVATYYTNGEAGYTDYPRYAA